MPAGEHHEHDRPLKPTRPVNTTALHEPVEPAKPSRFWTILTSGAAVGAVISLLLGAYNYYTKPPETPPTQRRWQKVSIVDPDAAYQQRLAWDRDHHWEKPSLAVYSVPYVSAPPAPLTLKDLSDNGQAHAIDYIFKKVDSAGTVGKDQDPKADELQNTLHSFVAALSAQTDAARIDPYRANRVLIATVAKGLDNLPGDRILWTRIFVKPINFQFAGYNVVASDNRSIKIATVESSVDTKFSFKATPNLGPASSGSSELSSETGKSQKATADVTESYENLGVDIQPGFMRIIRESAQGGDVSGNTIVQLSMLTEPTKIGCSALKIDDCQPKPRRSSPQMTEDHKELDDQFNLLVSSVHPSVDENDLHPIVLPQVTLPHCPLMADVWMLYEIRTIKKRRDSFVEGDQTVDLVKDSYDVGPVVLVPADDISPAVWTIKRTDPAKRPVEDGDEDLTAKLQNGTERRLVFTDALTATQVAHWIKLQLSKTDPHLTDQSSNLAFIAKKDSTLTPFKHVPNDCKEPLPMHSR